MGGALCQDSSTHCPGFGCITESGLSFKQCMVEGERCIAGAGVLGCCPGYSCVGEVNFEKCVRNP